MSIIKSVSYVVACRHSSAYVFRLATHTIMKVLHYIDKTSIELDQLTLCSE